MDDIRIQRLQDRLQSLMEQNPDSLNDTGRLTQLFGLHQRSIDKLREEVARLCEIAELKKMPPAHFDPERDVREAYAKFDIGYAGPPRLLKGEEQAFVSKTLLEEVSEYDEAVEKKDAEAQLDALVDLVYFAIGATNRCGWSFREAWNRVHEKNMLKQRGTGRRGFGKDLVKPHGWAPPDLSDLVAPRPTLVESPLSDIP